MKQSVNHENKEHQQNGNLHDEEAQAFDSPFKLSFWDRVGESFGDFTAFSEPSSSHDHGHCCPADDGCSHQEIVIPF